MMDSAMSVCPGTTGTPNCCGAFACLPSFVAGVLALALVEFLIVLVLLERFLNISSRPSVSPVSDLKIGSGEDSICVQGKAWVAPLPDHVDLSKVIMRQIRKEREKEKGEDGLKDASRRGEDTKGVLEIAPVRMQAILKDKILFLTAVDGTQAKISLEGCEVLTVSSSPGPNRKWGKKFPIKLHSDRQIYRGCKTLLFFAESGYAKEAWCEAFRTMARMDPKLSARTFMTKRKYREYTFAAEENMPYLTKFYATDEVRHLDVKQKESGVQSRARKMTDKWKRLTRKVSIGKDHTEPKFAQTADEAYRRHEVHRRKESRSHKHDDTDSKNKDVAFADEDHRDTVAETASQVDPNFNRYEVLANGEASAGPIEGISDATASIQKDNREFHDQVPVTQQRAHESKDVRAGKEIEQGVLCLNMIVARLYFDFNRNERRLASVERFFQRLLSKIRAPSYMKSITIKELDLGRHPPFATAVRMVPADAEGALAVEVDLQWLGGGHLTCESRLDLCEQSTQEKVVDQLTESGSERDAAAALLSGIRGDFDVSGSGSFSAAVQEGRQLGDEGSNKKGRIMSMMSRVADRVSQVPLVLKIKLVSLKGTAVFKLKAPPSDRVWFAFKTMPEIHFEPMPCIGEHRISSGALGNFIAKQIKIQIRESVVLPYFEDFFLDWMVADKDNWLPISAFPLPFFDSQLSEAERKLFKRIAETQSSSSDENGHQSQSTRNGQSKPPKGEASQGPSKAQNHAHFSHANSYQPNTSTQDSNHSFLHSLRSNPDHSIFKLPSSKPPRSVSSDNLNTQSSVPRPPKPITAAAHLSAVLSDPVQAIGSTALSLTSPSMNKESMPLLDYERPCKEENFGSAGDDSRSKDYSVHSEGSASESDIQFLDTQVANPEGVNELSSVVPLTRRAKLRKALDEGRRNVAEKLHHKRPDDSVGSGHHQPSGRWAHET
ncbi:hypothetical protein KC19_11G125600 [Ceratodon purpureus]|uniref:SMP-LTD domain-containing protein n=1 Tax=Ceratodon purpureus TaxID=3225 RepID=A0A8T0GD93_CERPU|nr:hypothetical protein KC19_11G125600 [Ceratodon purpureus]